MTSIFYFGKQFSCNCCGCSFRKFKPKGNGLVERENAQCPYCGSLERTRLLLFYLRNETKLFSENVKLLHFAPEWSLYPIFKKAKNIEYFAVDLNPVLADQVVDIMAIPFADNSFDFIICSMVLGFVSDEPKAIKEMLRVLKPDGMALIQTLIDLQNPHTFETTDADTPEKRLQYYTEPDGERLHGTDFAQGLQTAGFQVETIDYAAQLGDDWHQKYALGNGCRELIFQCTKG
ncbi:MAG: methyltransferase domain-containing protein [Candidatus Symbiothrix sp.]|nr:methyltransferase domain-containing protein [Candidatus Symbiothrix sp.]